ncbi:MAG: OmpA family protein, partial [Myxococcota bacterium]|nr:OmpA family protein [Myxococcota bacterium]
RDYPGHRRPAGAIAGGAGCASAPNHTPAAPVMLLGMLLGGLLVRRRKTDLLKHALAMLTMAALLLPATIASAQEGYDALRFRPLGLGNGGITVIGSDTAQTLDFDVTATYYFAGPSVNLIDPTTDEVLLPVVSNEQGMHLRASLGVIGGLQTTIEAPLLLTRNINPNFEQDIQNGTIGDLGVHVRYGLFDRRERPLGIGFDADITIPTGNARALTGSGAIGAGARAMLDQQFGPFYVAANLGYRYRDDVSFEGSKQGGAATYGVAGRFRILRTADLGLLAEINGESTPSENLRSGAEALFGLQASLLGFNLTLGGGPGLGAEVGTPAWRAFMALGYAPGSDDRDGDGVRDSLDSCQATPEDLDGFEDGDGCPEPDNDGDGVPDSRDKCIMDAEDRDGFEDADGCPEPDNDGDGVDDSKDTCPNQAEDLDSFQDNDGCPDNDNDGDGLVDAQDLCPNEAESPNGFKDDDGCPDEKPTYVFTREKTVVVYSIQFESGSDKLKSESFAVLDDVAKSLKAQPEVRVRIEGHTDDKGKDKENLLLSQQRALSVFNYLVEKGGIERTRLEYEGYGETRPLEKDSSEEARAKNRRVEFRVIP